MPESGSLSQALPEDRESDQIEVRRPDQDAGVTLFVWLLESTEKSQLGKVGSVHEERTQVGLAAKF